MQSLLEFLYRYRAIALFFVLEIFCGWMIVNYNSYQGSAFFNSSNIITGSILKTTDNIKYYFNLRSTNLALAEENDKLRTKLLRFEQGASYDSKGVKDSLLLNQFSFVTAKVINNSTVKSSNYFTIDKGTNDGLAPGMGILSVNGGVAGRIKACSNHYSTAISVLNEKWALSAKITRENADGVVEWKSGSPTEADLIHVGKHHKIFEGDTVVTSGFSSVFPYGVVIGTIKSVVDDGSKYIIKVKLASDYTSMSYVSVINNKLRTERDSLETLVNAVQEK